MLLFICFQETIITTVCVCYSGKPQEDQSGWMGYLNSAIKQSATYLPSGVTDMFNQGRSFAICKLPSQGLKNVCAIAK